MEELKKKLELIESGLKSAENYLCDDLDAICDDTMCGYAEETLGNVLRSLKEVTQLLDDVCVESNRSMACGLLKKDGIFYITGVSREDIESRGFDTSGLSDEQMCCFADKMADNYIENYYWDSIDALAYCYGLPIKDNSNE